MFFHNASLQHYIFDLDGTLLDTAPDVLQQLELVIRDNGYDIPPLQADILGPVLEKIIEHLLPGITKETSAALIAQFRAQYKASGFPLTRVYTGIPHVLQTLYSQGSSLYVATNKPRLLTESILKQKNLIHFFKEIICCDDAPTKLSKAEMLKVLINRHSIHQKACIMIGDTYEDLRGANTHGIASAAVLYGYGEKEKIYKEHPSYIIKDEEWQSIQQTVNN